MHCLRSFLLCAILIWSSPCVAQTVFSEVAISVKSAYPRDVSKALLVTKFAGPWHNRVLRGQAIDAQSELIHYQTQFRQQGIDLCEIANDKLKTAMQLSGL